MEPTRLTVRVITSPWRAAHFERYPGIVGGVFQLPDYTDRQHLDTLLSHDR